MANGAAARFNDSVKSEERHCDPRALPSPSRPAMLGDRSAASGEPYVAGRQGLGIFEAAASYQPPGFTPQPWFSVVSESPFGPGAGLPGPVLGLGLDGLGDLRRPVVPSVAPWNRPEEPEIPPPPSKSFEDYEEERLRTLEQQLDSQEYRLQREHDKIQRERKELREGVESMLRRGEEILKMREDTKKKEGELQDKQRRLFYKELKINELKEEVELKIQEFQKKHRDQLKDHDAIQLDLNDLQQQDKGCEQKLAAAKGAMDRLLRAEQEVELKCKQFEDEKRQLENANAIYNTEIRRLKHKIEQTRMDRIDRKIIPVGHDGTSSYNHPPPDLPAPGANLAPPAAPYPPPAPAAAPSFAATAPRPAGRGQILDAAWGELPRPARPPAAGTPAPL